MNLSLSPGLSIRQATTVGPLLQQAIFLLRLGNQDLADYLDRQAEENPFLEVRRPDAPPPPRSLAGRRDEVSLESIAAAPGPSLHVHVAAEIRRLFPDPAEARVAGFFAAHLAPSGWLDTDCATVAAEAGVPLTQAEGILARLQTIEPAGLFARSLTECLRLQARAENVLSPLMEAVLRHLPLLAEARLGTLAQACGTGIDGLRPVLQRLRGFQPKPGTLFDVADAPVRSPDLIVSRREGEWVVELNRSTLPALVVNAPARPARDRAVGLGAYVADRIAAARWLDRAIAHRNMTTLKVGAEAMRRQSAFLEHGPAHLRPMVLRDVAEAIGVHPSTVSRVTQSLLVATPQGTFPLKHFFTAALSRADGGADDSAAAIRHRIRQLVGAEDPAAPLSDDTLAEMISHEGTQLARRTVAKYRKQLRIASSFQRRRSAVLAGRA